MPPAKSGKTLSKSQIELIKRALKADPATSGIPVIVLSNLSQDTDVQAMLLNGAVEYLVDFQIEMMGFTPDTPGVRFDTAPRPQFVMPAIEEQTLDRLRGV